MKDKITRPGWNPTPTLPHSLAVVILFDAAGHLPNCIRLIGYSQLSVSVTVNMNLFVAIYHPCDEIATYPVCRPMSMSHSVQSARFKPHSVETCCSEKKNKLKLKVKRVWASGETLSILLWEIEVRWWLNHCYGTQLCHDRYIAQYPSKHGVRCHFVCLSFYLKYLNIYWYIQCTHTHMLSRGWIVITFISQLFLSYHVNIQVNNSLAALPAYMLLFFFFPGPEPSKPNHRCDYGHLRAQ